MDGGSSACAGGPISISGISATRRFFRVRRISRSCARKKIFDSRTGMAAWTPNCALMAYDWLQDDKFGIGTDSGNIGVDETEAAANSCEEMVATQAITMTVTAIDTATDILSLTDTASDKPAAVPARRRGAGDVFGFSAGWDFGGDGLLRDPVPVRRRTAPQAGGEPRRRPGE